MTSMEAKTLTLKVYTKGHYHIKIKNIIKLCHLMIIYVLREDLFQYA